MARATSPRFHIVWTLTRAAPSDVVAAPRRGRALHPSRPGIACVSTLGNGHDLMGNSVSGKATPLRRFTRWSNLLFRKKPEDAATTVSPRQRFQVLATIITRRNDARIDGCVRRTQCSYRTTRTCRGLAPGRRSVRRRGSRSTIFERPVADFQSGRIT